MLRTAIKQRVSEKIYRDRIHSISISLILRLKKNKQNHHFHHHHHHSIHIFIYILFCTLYFYFIYVYFSTFCTISKTKAQNIKFELVLKLINTWTYTKKTLKMAQKHWSFITVLCFVSSHFPLSSQNSYTIFFSPNKSFICTHI